MWHQHDLRGGNIRNTIVNYTFPLRCLANPVPEPSLPREELIYPGLRTLILNHDKNYGPPQADFFGFSAL